MIEIKAEKYREFIDNILKYYNVSFLDANHLLGRYQTLTKDNVIEELNYKFTMARLESIAKTFNENVSDKYKAFSFIFTLNDMINKGLVHPILFNPIRWEKFIESQKVKKPFGELFTESIDKVFSNISNAIGKGANKFVTDLLGIDLKTVLIIAAILVIFYFVLLRKVI